MRSRKLLAGVFLLAAAVLLSGCFLADRKDEGVLLASGTIEATGVDVSFQIAGRVAEVGVWEGQSVSTGDVLARLSDEELTERVKQIQAALDAVANQTKQQETMVQLRSGVIQSQIAQARGEAEAMQVAAERVRQGPRPEEIRIAEAELAQAEATLTQRRADFERATGLFKEGIIPRQQFEVVEVAARTAQGNRDAASERVALARAGSRSEDIAEADARSKAAQAGVAVAEAGRREITMQGNALDAARAHERDLASQLESANTQFGYTVIHSPLNGVVLTKNVESGEVVSPGTPVVTVANIDELWMNIYIPETQTGLIKLGQAVNIRVDSFPGETFKGKVTFVSSESEFTPKTILTQEERVKLVYRVKVSLENTGQRLKPGMPADAEIVLK